ncbi:MAG: ABC transporter permease [Mycoplasmatales bacterium]
MKKKINSILKVIIENKKYYLLLLFTIILSLLLAIFINVFLGLIIISLFLKINYKKYSGRTRYIIKRIGLMCVTLFFIITITFFLVFLMPGQMIPNAEKLPADQLQRQMEFYGFNRPVIIQYFDYLKGILLEGDYGISLYDKMPVIDKIAKAVPISFSIGIISIIFGTIVGVFLGLIAALKKNTWLDYTTTIIAVLGISIPSFVLATLNQQVFAVNLGLFPATYNGSPNFSALLLPIFSLSIFTIASMARFTRTEMLETLNSNYITLARAKGVSKNQVIFKHGFRNALVPIITVLGPMVIAIITGSLVVETIFAIPGLGSVLTNAVLSKDVFMIVATTMFLSVLYLFTYLVIDILYTFVDPRINLGDGE